MIEIIIATVIFVGAVAAGMWLSDRLDGLYIEEDEDGP